MTLELMRVRVDGFRGLRCLEVELSPLTVLIGESRVGKTTLLDALERCLGVGRDRRRAPFEEDDFVAEGEGLRPIELTLEFAGESSDPVLEELAWEGRNGERHLVLRVSAPGPGQVRWAFLGPNDEVLYDDAPASICDRLRALHPVLLIDAERYARQTNGEAGDDADLPSIFQRLFARRGALSAEELREGLSLLETAVTSSEGEEEMIRGRRATARLRDIVDAPGRLRALPEEVLGSLRSAGTQSMALFLLVAFLLEVRAGEAMVEGAVPIVAIEEPELRLHPTVAASLWGILELFPGQKLITTNSPQLLSGAPLSALRRMERHDGEVRVHRLRRKTLTLEELRRIAFHLRLQQAVSLFARCWLLVEGESEVWLLSELARQCGYVLPAEGVACLTFAQCGLLPIVLLADDLGIDWHVMVDGDEAGQRYVDYARERLKGRREEDHVTLLDQPNVEAFMWSRGYAEVYRKAAGDTKPRKRQRRRNKGKRRGFSQRQVIKRAIRATSKPGLALRVAVAASREDGPGVPAELRAMLDRVVGLARRSGRGIYEEIAPKPEI